MAAAEHIPVLAGECMKFLQPQPAGRFIDCTVNGGGHSVQILERTAPDGTLLALDADPDAVALARDRLAQFGPRARVIHSNFRSVETVAHEQQFADVDGVLMDLGLSSLQLAAIGRGFSFSRDEPLDMRFDTSRGATAADYLASASPDDIERTLRSFGEEPAARRIAAAIAAGREQAPVRTTGELVTILQRSVGHFRRAALHPATRTFQALRIVVNEELASLQDALPAAVRLLRPGGRLVVIAFHSLEDRIVKTVFRELAGRQPDETPRGLPTSPARPAPQIRIVTPRPVRPSKEEVVANPRSRSARLRVAERL
jgi:16S rRNA (cytosine1402-N4)-methyltransferase